MAERKAQMKEVEEFKIQTKTLEEELERTREDRDKAVATAQKFHDFIGHLDDVVNKAGLYDERTGQPGSLSKPKII